MYYKNNSQLSESCIDFKSKINIIENTGRKAGIWNGK